MQIRSSLTPNGFRTLEINVGTFNLTSEWLRSQQRVEVFVYSELFVLTSSKDKSWKWAVCPLCLMKNQWKLYNLWEIYLVISIRRWEEIQGKYFYRLDLNTWYKCLQKTVQRTFFHLLESSSKFQFLAPSLCHCVFMILINSSEMRSVISLGVEQLLRGQINIYILLLYQNPVCVG